MLTTPSRPRVGWRLVIARVQPETHTLVLAVDQLLPAMPAPAAEAVADQNFDIVRRAGPMPTATTVFMALFEWHPNDDTVPQPQMTAAEWYQHYIRGGPGYQDAFWALTNLWAAPQPPQR